MRRNVYVALMTFVFGLRGKKKKKTLIYIVLYVQYIVFLSRFVCDLHVRERYDKYCNQNRQLFTCRQSAKETMYKHYLITKTRIKMFTGL